MRNTAISTSISSVVFRVIDVVAGAGFAHGRLALAALRERMGSWQEQYLLGLTMRAMCRDLDRSIALNPKPGKPGTECTTRHSSKHALAVLKTPRSLAVRALSHS